MASGCSSSRLTESMLKMGQDLLSTPGESAVHRLQIKDWHLTNMYIHVTVNMDIPAHTELKKVKSEEIFSYSSTYTMHALYMSEKGGG